jgi:putative (di)nucleoside polyphosphate hydrolase
MKDKNNYNERLYRPCVVGVFVNSKNEVLIALRSDKHSWQFPQGGVEEGESFKVALFREMKEEIGCDQFDVVKQSSKKLKYKFPPTLKGPIAKQYQGQEQTWFLCRFKEGFSADLKQGTSDEFIDVKWVSPTEIVQSVVDWKREVYIQGLQELGLLKSE